MPGGTLTRLAGSDQKADLHRYLRRGREAVLWKLDGLSEYDVRRPLTPTGTNLLGLVKHLATMEFGYFGDCFGRPPGEPLPRAEEDAEDAEPNADLWRSPASPASRSSGCTSGRAPTRTPRSTRWPDAPGRVPWWTGSGEVTLHRILVHMVSETDRHAGHADIVRELIDGAAGLSPGNNNLARGNDNMSPDDRAWWETYRSRLETVAGQFAGG